MELLNFTEGDDLNEENIIRKGLFEDIRIYDDFLSDYHLRKLMDIIKDRLMAKDLERYPNGGINAWHTSIGYHPYNFSHWSTSWNDVDFINTEIVSLIEERVNKKLKVLRTYTSFQGPEEHGLWHTDDNEKNAYTFTLYLAFYKNVMVDTNFKDEIVSELCDNLNVLHHNTKVDFEDDFFLKTNESIFKIKNYTKTYSNDTFIPISERDSIITKEDKKKKMLDILERFREDDLGGDFWWFNQGRISKSPFIENRGVFFSARESHNGDALRNSFYKDESNYERIVVSFKLEEV
jgi:hypothetical protein